MFKNMKLSVKITLGFAIVLAITAVIGFAGFYGLNSVDNIVARADDSYALRINILELRRKEKDFMIRENEQYIKDFEDTVNRTNLLCDQWKGKFSSKETIARIDEIKTNIAAYHQGFREYVASVQKQTQAAADMVEAAHVMEDNTYTAWDVQKKKLDQQIIDRAGRAELQDRVWKVSTINQLRLSVLQMRRHEKDYMNRRDDKYIDELKTEAASFKTLAVETRSRHTKADDQQRITNALTAMDDYLKQFEVYVAAHNANLKTEEKMITDAHEVIGHSEEFNKELGREMNSTSAVVDILILALALGGLLIGIILAILIVRGIVKPIRAIIDGLNKGAGQISIASNQLSSSSQEVANGASEQAASIEETTASMEELGTMVKQNSGNAKEAAALSEKTRDSSQNGYSKMEDMLTSMNELNRSSEQIKNIINSIDNLAFQTNILALNAAVEAARAGEAGMGFAVVADEVKNLANRSAEAAKETAVIINESIKKTGNGLEIATRLSDVFKEILTNIQKLAELVKEVETASRQQDTGINQVNQAILQLDKVVQANAASAEESASSAEEMTSQAEALNTIVSQLTLLISGKNERIVESIHQYSVKSPKPAGKTQKGITYYADKKSGNGKNRNLSVHTDFSAEKLIPFEEDEDFTHIGEGDS